MRTLELLTSKICHDTSGSVGAINNGIELLDEFGEQMQTQSIDLIRLGSMQAFAKIIFFKHAYGYSQSNKVDKNKIASIASDYFKLKNIEFNLTLDENEQESLIKSEVSFAQIILQSCEIVSTTLIKGGMIDIQINSSNLNNFCFEFIGSGKRIQIDQEVLKVLLNEDLDPNELNVQNIQAYVLVQLLKLNGLSHTIEISDDNCQFTVQNN